MMKTAPGKRIPCHLLAGPLGVGKTTAILNYLKTKEDAEHVAVLVNDFGANGLDGRILGGEGRAAQGALTVTPVPGGCLCCTSAAYFDIHLEKLAATGGIDRIIIEPSGIVLLDQMKAMLAKRSASLALDIRPVIVLINLARFSKPRFIEIPYYAMLVREADILVGNRRDLATAAQAADFLAYAESLSAQGKRVYVTSHGRLLAEAFAPLERSLAVRATNSPPDHLHRERRRTGSLEWTPDTCFELGRLTHILTTWNDAAPDPDGRRIKATLFTDQGWRLIDVAQGGLHIRPFPPQSMNRLDWIDTGEDETCCLATKLEHARTP